MTRTTEQEAVLTWMATASTTARAIGRALQNRGFDEDLDLMGVLLEDATWMEEVTHSSSNGVLRDIYMQLKLIRALMVETDSLRQVFYPHGTGVTVPASPPLQMERLDGSLAEATGGGNWYWMGATEAKIGALAIQLAAAVTGDRFTPRDLMNMDSFIIDEARAIWLAGTQSDEWKHLFVPADQICDTCGDPAADGHNGYCREHWRICIESGCTTGWPTLSRNGEYCTTHRSQCEDCGRLVPRRGLTQGRCRDCRRGRLNGYRHTSGEFLGGPLPKVTHRGKESMDGYYIGFELEIGVRNPFPNSVRDWAKEHMGNREALDCKDDSSVQGFEIASWPMTPKFFEELDWAGFFRKLNRDNPLAYGQGAQESAEHGLHVHIGRVAFRGSTTALAAFAYLIDAEDSLQRVGRREPYHYCKKVDKRVSTVAAKELTGGRQKQRLDRHGFWADRDAVNLLNSNTIEIRAFRSTRKASELKKAVRWVYLTADYVRHLQDTGVLSSPKHLTIPMFRQWVKENHPDKLRGLFL